MGTHGTGAARFVIAAFGLIPGAAVTGASGATATKLSSFEGSEEPAVVYHPSTKSFTDDAYKNMVDTGNGVVRFSLRYRPDQDWWDGDRTTTNDDRQRAEVKGLGVHQKTGETFEYAFDFRTDPNFVGTSSFCHVFQLKATDGDNGAPLVTLSLKAGNKGQVQVWSGTAAGSTVARTFTWEPDKWEHAVIRITTSTGNTGSVTASINGDAFSGLTGAGVYRPDATDYRPKWGFYRGINTDLFVGENWVEQKEWSSVKLVPEPGGAAVGATAGSVILGRRSRPGRRKP